MTDGNGGRHGKPLIGLSGRRKAGRDFSGFADSLHHLVIDLYVADYTRDVLAAGGLPVHIPMDADPGDYADHLDGVLLTGGADVEPIHYGQEPDGNGFYEPERDELELELLSVAIEVDIPVLGICRGLQIINVHAGGTLHQHVPEHSRYDIPAHERIHEVSLHPESRLGLLYRNGSIGDRSDAGVVEVNSLHHQSVDRLGAELQVTARHADGVVEGIEQPGRDVVAVQWHPEMHREPEPVFDWLIRRARQRREAG